MKVLIVDDEVLICEWLQFCIEQNPAWQLVGCAHNGQEGLALFRQHKPGLVLTDIKMPVMDGLELLGHIREEAPETHVVLLTAFSEFDLARDAMRKGAAEYILKTEFNKESLARLLDRFSEQTTGESNNGSGENWKRQAVLKNMILRKEVLEAEDVARLKAQGVHWRDDGLFAIAVPRHHIGEGFSFPPSGHIRHLMGFEYDESTYVAVGNLPRKTSAEIRNKAFGAYLKAMVEMNGCMAGVSRICDDMAHLPSLVAEAVAALGLGFYEGQARAYRWPRTMDAVSDRYMHWQRQLKQMYLAFYAAPLEEKHQIARRGLAYAGEEQVYPVQLVAHFCLSVLEELFAQERQATAGNEAFQQIIQAFTRQDAFSGKAEVFLAALEEYLPRQAFAVKDLSPGVAKAVGYIRQNYAGSLSLEQTAEVVDLNPEYLSRIFKEEVGATFTAFLTDIRMKKAAGLLRDTNQKVNKVGQEVGYPNVSYFSTLFKKTYGLNPFEYRRQHHT